jgi:YidC/Oxa1 family membrane protein insertase
MQEQGKRLLIAVAVTLGFLLLWQQIFGKKAADQDAQQSGETGSGSGSSAGSGSGSNASFTSTPMHSNVGVTSSTPSAECKDQTITLTFSRLTATFGSCGARLASWHLTDERYLHDPGRGELLPDIPGTGALNIELAPDSTYRIPDNAAWTGHQLSPTEIEYTYENDQLALTKHFTVVPNEFMVKLDVKLAVKSAGAKGAHETLEATAYQVQDPKKATSGSSRGAQPRQWDSSTLRADGELLSTQITSILEHGARYEGAIKWTGFEHPFLLVAFAPNPAGGIVAKRTFAEPTGLMQTDMIFAASLFKQGDPPVTRQIVGYLGPKSNAQLDHADEVAGFSTGFKETVDLGYLRIIAQPMLWLMLTFHSVVGNWGIAIVLLTLVVKGVTLFWTTKSMRSMKAMAVLGPQMKGLQEKFKEDKQRLQAETMALYKQHGVNPLAGCLPMLLQMPIWWALYRMLAQAGELYQQPFIPGWINDLTAADPYYVLPILLIVTMFAQARLTPTTIDPSQQMQQRLMQYGMPLIFGFASLFFPAGLTLYIFTNTCLSALHSIWINKYDKKSVALTAQLKKNQAATAAAKAAAAAKNAKDSNAKDGNAKDGNAKDGDANDAGAKDSGSATSTAKLASAADASSGEQAQSKPRGQDQQRRKKGGRR